MTGSSKASSCALLPRMLKSLRSILRPRARFPALALRSHCSPTTASCAMSASRLRPSPRKDRRTALAAIAAIKFSSETLPAVIGLDAARKPDAPVVFAKADRKKAGNVSEGGGAPASWNGNVRGPTAAFSQKASAPRPGSTEARERRDPLLVRSNLPRCDAVACVPRAARHRRPLRRRSPDRACLDPGRVPVMES